MPFVHDTQFRTSLRTRLQALRPDAAPRWGQMTVDQMLWHVGDGFEMALGNKKFAPGKTPLPAPLMRAMVINLPWPKGAPTMPELIAKERYDFEAERERCLRLLDAASTRRIDDPWPAHPVLGKMSGRAWSKLMARHVDHHLKQFGA